MAGKAWWREREGAHLITSIGSRERGAGMTADAQLSSSAHGKELPDFN